MINTIELFFTTKLLFLYLISSIKVWNSGKSFTNFLLVNFDRATISSNRVFQKLANLGILVRKMNVYAIKNSLRITIGNNIENKKFINTLRKII